MYKFVFEYPAIITQKNGKIIADCKALNLVGVGINEEDAVENLKKAASKDFKDYEVVIIPIKKVI